MFDNVHFSGDISLGAFSIALTQLVLALTIYVRQLVIERREEQKRRDIEEKHNEQLAVVEKKNTSQ